MISFAKSKFSLFLCFLCPQKEGLSKTKQKTVSTENPERIMGDSKPFPPQCLGATVLGGCQGSACPQVPSHPITLVPLPQWLFPGELPLSSCRTSKGTNTALQGGSQRQRWKELPRPLKPAGCPAVYPGKLDPSVEGSGRGQCWQIPRKLQKQVCFNRGQISYPPKPLSPEGLWDCLGLSRKGWS